MAKTKSREKRERRMASAKTRSAMGGSFERPSLATPKGCTVVSWNKEGVYRYDIVPYELKEGHGNPFARRMGLNAGDLHYERVYYTHRLPGEGNDSYSCLKMNFNKPCPVCEHKAKLVREGADEEETKAHKWKIRQLFNFIDKDEPDKGVQVFDSSTFGFGELLETRVNTADDDEEVEFFYGLDNGKTLKITAKEQPGMKKFFKAVDIQFKDRKPFGEDVLEKTFNLDDMVAELTYDELKKRYFAAPTDEAEDGDDEAPPPKGKKGKPAPTDDEDDEPEPPKKKPAGKPKAAEPEDDDDDDLDDDDSDLEPEDDEDTGDFEPGDSVSFMFANKKRIGVVKKVNATKELCEVEVPGQEKKPWVDFADLTKLEPPKKAKKPDPEDGEDEPAPKKKPTPAATKPKTKAPPPDDDDDLDDIDSELDDLDDEDDEPFDLDDDDEPEPPKKKPKK